MALKRKCLAGFLAFALCLGLTPVFAVSAYADGHGGNGGGVSDSSDYEYYQITVKSADGQTIGYKEGEGTAGDHTWLVQGTYNANFTMTQGINSVHYVIGNQSGDVSFTLPEGYEVGSWTPVYEFSDASVNTQSSRFDCCIATVTINTIVNTTTDEEIPYTYYGATVLYKDIDSKSEIADAVKIEKYGLAGSSYNLNKYAIDIEGYDYVKTESNDGDSLTGTLTKDVEVTVWYKKTAEDEEKVVPPADEGDEDGTTEDDGKDGVDAEEEAEEAEEADTVIPQTGDNAPVAVGLLGMAAAAAVALASRFKMNAA